MISTKSLRSVATACIAAISLSIHSQPSMIHLGIDGATEKGKPAPVTVTWCSEKGPESQYVIFGTSPDPSKEVKAAETVTDCGSVYKVKLARLKPGKKYYYKCGSDATGWSQVYSFSSEPRNGSFRVAVIGDTQDNTNNENFVKTAAIVSAVKEYYPAITLHMGDMVNDGSDDVSWKEFLNVSQELNAVSPLMPVLGNHDINNEKGENFQEPFETFHDLFNLPGDEVNYSFTYGKVRFIGVFSGYAQGAEPLGSVKFKPGSPEYIWLENELSKAENDRGLDWIIVWMHYPVNSFGWSNIKAWKDNILPLLERHRVDLCLAGHRHVYERHLQMKDGRIAKKNPSNSLSADDGTVFITNGTAGGNPTGPGGKEIPTIAFTPEKSMYSYAIMDINPSSLKYQVFDADKNPVDSFTLYKQPR
jgi:predicted phosphodiesterase